MTTIRGEVSDKVEGLHVGADDYLAKPVDTRELEARIFAALRAKAARSELQKRNTQLEEMLRHAETLALTDSLTGLFNRRRCAELARRELAVTRRYKNPLSCVMIDLDHFKRINDVHGHAAGDEVLRTVAHLLSQNLREVDVAARYGGEEFALLLPHTAKMNAWIVAERLRTKIEALELSYESQTLSVTASFGVADDKDAPTGRWEDLFRAADIALYRAKGRGRNQTVLAEPGQVGPPLVG
jgi:diguanylate cyclase (GGDEF)-like protein